MNLFTFRLTGLACACLTMAGAASAQNHHLNGGAPGVPRYLTVQGTETANAVPDAGTGLPSWTHSFTYKGKSYTFRMVGTDPALGSVSTTVPAVIVPIIFKIGGVTFDPTQNANASNISPLKAIVLSPLFQSADFKAGSTDVGTTQYIDAFQRANFWSSVSTSSPGYHVLLSKPTIHAPITINVPAGFGSTQSIPNPPYNTTLGEVSITYYQAVVNKVITALKFSPTQLPIFIYYNVFMYQGTPNNCCILGFHGSTTTSPTSQTYSNAAFNDPGIFVDSNNNPLPIQDIHALSHELGEWMDDPQGNNIVPGWSAGQAAGSCQTNLEDGDPVTGIAFTVNFNGFTYHPEDLVFAPWFEQLTPSTSVNGWYTFLNTFSTPPTVCN